MISACVFVLLLEHPASPRAAGAGRSWLRRCLIGVAMGLTAIALIYSPMGKRSGAHLNPAVTLTFWRLGKIEAWDAVFYVAAQFVGGCAGVCAGRLGARAQMLIGDAAVNYAVTLPGRSGPVGRVRARRSAISFGLMLMVLIVSNRPCAQPLHRTVRGRAGRAVHHRRGAAVGHEHEPGAHAWPRRCLRRCGRDLWIYFLAPPLGMLLAARDLSAVARRAGRAVLQAAPRERQRCIFRVPLSRRGSGCVS